MSAKQVEILFVSGSPRAHTSEALLGLLGQGARDVGARSRRFLLSQKRVAPCMGCGSCEKTGTCILADKNSRLFINDDYAELMDALHYADALAVVSPLFFSGPPAQLKALYDRMQPLWARKYVLEEEPPAKRPAQIFILGGGGDTHGYEPLVTISRSALAVAGFTLEKVQNFIGFKHMSDVAMLPTEEEASNMAFGELAHLRKAVSAQRDFEQRAVAAGSAFARFVGKSLSKKELQEELQQVEAEMAELRDEASSDIPTSVALSFSDSEASAPPHMIVDQLDSDFEALKQTARAARSTKANQAGLKSVIEEAVAVLSGHDSAAVAGLDESVVEPEVVEPEVVDDGGEEGIEAGLEVEAEEGVEDGAAESVDVGAVDAVDDADDADTAEAAEDEDAEATTEDATDEDAADTDAPDDTNSANNTPAYE